MFCWWLDNVNYAVLNAKSVPKITNFWYTKLYHCPKINGYEATILLDICDGFLDARKNIKLSPRQEIIAHQAEILMRSFAKVGIIALVDEATGYQYKREKDELQKILMRINRMNNKKAYF